MSGVGEYKSAGGCVLTGRTSEGCGGFDSHAYGDGCCLWKVNGVGNLRRLSRGDAMQRLRGTKNMIKRSFTLRTD